MCIFTVILIIWIRVIMYAYTDVICTNIFQVLYFECHKHIKPVNSLHVSRILIAEPLVICIQDIHCTDSEGATIECRIIHEI